jgi:hypothetical protein
MEITKHSNEVRYMKLVCKQCNTEIEILETKLQGNELIIKGYYETHGKLVLYLDVMDQ